MACGCGRTGRFAGRLGQSAEGGLPSGRRRERDRLGDRKDSAQLPGGKHRASRAPTGVRVEKSICGRAARPRGGDASPRRPGGNALRRAVRRAIPHRPPQRRYPGPKRVADARYRFHLIVPAPPVPRPRPYRDLAVLGKNLPSQEQPVRRRLPAFGVHCAIGCERGHLRNWAGETCRTSALRPRHPRGLGRRHAMRRGATDRYWWQEVGSAGRSRIPGPLPYYREGHGRTRSAGRVAVRIGWGGYD